MEYAEKQQKLVVHLSTVHHPHDTRILYRECISLAKSGYNVKLIISSTKKEVIENVEIIPLRRASSRLIRMTVTAYIAAVKALKMKADIYHFHDPELIPWAMLLKLLNKNVVYDMHENIISNINDKSWLPPLIRELSRKLFPLFLKHSLSKLNVVFAEESYIANYHWVESYALVQNYPDTNVLPMMPNSNKYSKFSMIYFGSISEIRGIIDVLDALVILKNNYDLDLYVVGKDDLTEGKNLIDLVEDRKLSNVYIKRFIPLNEAVKIISRCHLGLAVLHDIPNYRRSYPTKLFEYMGCGIPYITSDFDLYQEIINKWKCGVTVKPENVNLLVKKIEHFILEPEKIEEMGKLGCQAVKTEYNWAEQEKKLLNFYNSII